ncbi:MAG: HDIG domain-containing protein [Candidatus Lokiarchaeota archaeon]|nr:HDIG domain-containing protein [Candidatus Lokiarchaeota archaeon]
MDEINIIPNRNIALDLIRTLKLPFSIRYHSHAVAKKALEIAKQISKIELNIELIEIGALLHDIGRTRTHGFDHGIEGGKILKKRGFPESVARICERHILGGLDKDDAREVGLPIKNYLPETMEEKIVCLADKYMTGKKEVTVEERFKKWILKYGRTEILLKARRRVKKIQSEIKEVMNS